MRQSFDPDRRLPVFQIGDIMAAARLAEVGRSDQTAVVADQPDFNAFRRFAAVVNAIVEASQARSSDE